MSYSHQLTCRIAETSADTFSADSTEVGTVTLSDSPSFGPSVTNQLMTIAFSVTNLQSLYLLADKDLTIKTNSSGTPADTLNLKAGAALVWRKSTGYYAKPLTTDVTAFYLTTGTAATRLKYKILTT